MKIIKNTPAKALVIFTWSFYFGIIPTFTRSNQSTMLLCLLLLTLFLMSEDNLVNLPSGNCVNSNIDSLKSILKRGQDILAKHVVPAREDFCQKELI